MIKSALQQKTNIRTGIDNLKYKKEFRKNNPDYFDPQGFICMVGNQGSGKTLVAVNYVDKLMKAYPKCILVKNIELKDYPVDNKRIFNFEEPEDLLKFKNGKKGIIFFLDEIHLYFGSQKGANNINPDILQTICQQRKQRIHIIGTTQYYAQLNINLRRHFDTVLYCESKLFGLKQKISVIQKDSIKSKETSDQQLEGEVKDIITYWRSPKMFEKYDTYALINSKLRISEEGGRDIYDNTDTRLSNSIKLLGNSINNSVTSWNNNKNSY